MLKDSTMELLRDKQLQSYVRHAEWELPAMVPVSALPLLDNLKILKVVSSSRRCATPVANARSTAARNVIPFAVTQALRSLPQLRRLAFAGAAPGLADENFNFAEHLPSLHHLELREWTQPIVCGPKLQILCTRSLGPYLKTMGTVQRLILHQTEKYDEDDLRHALRENVSANLSREKPALTFARSIRQDSSCALQHLTLPPVHPISRITNILRIFASATELRTLTLKSTWDHAFYQGALAALDAFQLPSLHILRITGWDYGAAQVRRCQSEACHALTPLAPRGCETKAPSVCSKRWY